MSGIADADSARSEIEERVSDYLSELTEGRDASRAADFYTADAQLVGPSMAMGRDNLAELIRGLFEAGVRIEVDRHSSELFVHGDVAYQVGQYDETAKLADGEPGEWHEYFFVRWEKGTDGMWRISHFLSAPREAPAEG